MKLFVVHVRVASVRDILGIFDSEQKADDEANKYCAQNKIIDYEISEFELDKVKS